jgi:hypothetical protein
MNYDILNKCLFFVVLAPGIARSLNYMSLINYVHLTCNNSRSLGCSLPGVSSVSISPRTTIFPCTTSSSLCSFPSWSEVRTVGPIWVVGMLDCVAGDPGGIACGDTTGIGEAGTWVWMDGTPTATSVSGTLCYKSRKMQDHIMKFSQAISWVKWLNGEETNISKNISVLILRVQPLDLVDSTRELHYIQSPGKQQILHAGVLKKVTVSHVVTIFHLLSNLNVHY